MISDKIVPEYVRLKITAKVTSSAYLFITKYFVLSSRTGIIGHEPFQPDIIGRQL